QEQPLTVRAALVCTVSHSTIWCVIRNGGPRDPSVYPLLVFLPEYAPAHVPVAMFNADGELRAETTGAA
ncbi:MAG: hypothetical protein M3319_09075, partial [Actinomycetota bacterium]|nr:hypothetical protein [Actinomycetota bacterium]